METVWAVGVGEWRGHYSHRYRETRGRLKDWYIKKKLSYQPQK